MLPLESVEVTGIMIAIGVVGKVTAGAIEGVMTLLLDAGTGGTTAGVEVDDGWTTRAFVGGCWILFPAGLATRSAVCGFADSRSEGTCALPKAGTVVEVGS